MRLQRVATIVVCLSAVVACKKTQQASVKDAEAPTKSTQPTDTISGPDASIFDTVHGDAVDQQYAFIPYITDDQLLAYQGGSIDGVDPTRPPGTDPLAPINETLYALQGGSTPYMDKCKAAGVPIPPAWGSNDWAQLGELPKDRIFASQANYQTVAFVHKASNGTCAALPRMDRGKIKFLGIVCQGDNGKACFWDNLDPVTKRRQSDTAGLKPETMQDGSNLKENCTGCHRGDNAFIVHEDTVLKQLPTPTQRYAPVAAQTGWANPEGESTFAENCQQCHTVPQLSRPYCSTVLLKSVKGTTGTPTMPPKDSDKAEFNADVKAIETACRAL